MGNLVAALLRLLHGHLALLPGVAHKRQWRFFGTSDAPSRPLGAADVVKSSDSERGHSISAMRV